MPQKFSVMHPFPSDATFYRSVGANSTLSLPCYAPESEPLAEAFWVYKRGNHLKEINDPLISVVKKGRMVIFKFIDFLLLFHFLQR